jgi:enoyl-CoA hydratase/carnithine racemase
MSSFATYQDSFQFCRLERTDGVLEATLTTDGGPLLWGGPPHEELGHVFAAIAADPENKVVILTGSGDSFIKMGTPSTRDGTVAPSVWRDIATSGERLIFNHLTIPVPMIAAVNGPVLIHSELAVLCDIVLAAESAEFADLAHVPRGLVPGDGVDIIYPAIMGVNRARYFLLTGQRLSAARAMDVGIVAEVLPDAELLTRARALASQLARLPQATLRYSRQVLTKSLLVAAATNLRESLAMEGLAGGEFWLSKEEHPFW